jgi:NAD(P)-dependent dehydrogenase (short-subunit alcohol dehydrogenase family)
LASFNVTNSSRFSSSSSKRLLKLSPRLDVQRRGLARRRHPVARFFLDPASVHAEGIQAHVLDVTSDDSVARCLEEVGPLDAIVNNAAMFGGGPVEGYPLDRSRQMFETNTLGALRIRTTPPSSRSKPLRSHCTWKSATLESAA